MSQREFVRDESDAILWSDDPERAYLAQIRQQEEESRVAQGGSPNDSLDGPNTFDLMLQEVVVLTQNDTDFSAPTECLSGLYQKGDSLSTNTVNGSDDAVQLEPKPVLQLIDLGPVIPEVVLTEYERKLKVDDELERAACGLSLSDNLTGPGDSSGSEDDKKKRKRPQNRSPSRPSALTFGDRCVTPQRTMQTSLSPPPDPPGSPTSLRTNQTNRSELYHFTYETTDRAPPSPVPPFVVVYSSGSARVSVRPASRFVQSPTTVDEEIISPNQTLWKRACLFALLALLFLAMITMVAGLVKMNELRQSGSSASDVPTPQNQTASPTTLIPGPTRSPLFEIPNEDTSIITLDGDKLSREETVNPAADTRAPRTRAPIATPVPTFSPSLHPTSSPSLVPTSSTTPDEDNDGDYDEAIFRDETPSPAETQPTWPPRTQPPVPANPTQGYVSDLIAQVSTSSVEELSNSISPQFKALEWVASDPLVENGSYSDSRIIQRWVLATLFYSTTGDTWDNSNDWVSYTDDCNWFSKRNGHICDVEGNLEIIELEHNNLSGSIPPELGLLSNSLKKLFLRDNGLEGPLPTELGILNRLEFLQLTENDLQGPIPTEFGNLSNLIVLGLGRNDIEATLPSEFGKLNRLDTLGLEENAIHGTIPTEFGNMANMRLVAMCDNELSGSIPSELGALSRLVKLTLSGNEFVGNMSDEVCFLTNSTLTELSADCDEVACLCCHRCCTDGEFC